MIQGMTKISTTIPYILAARIECHFFCRIANTSRKRKLRRIIPMAPTP